MAKIVISGIASVIPEKPDGTPTTDAAALAEVHGMYSDETCEEYIDDELASVGVSGGRLRFVHDEPDGQLRITTTYNLTRPLSEEETSQLVEETVAQWADGIGGGAFGCHRGDILSSSLAMAIQNINPEPLDLGEFYLNAFPFADDREIRVEYSEDGCDDEELLLDLIAAVDGGSSEAMVELGQAYENGTMSAVRDGDKAYQLYTAAADAGHLVGVFCRGRCFQNGIGVEADVQKAVECFRHSADHGMTLAMHMLGVCYADGIGVDVDIEQAVKWYEMGAEQGDPGCLAELGECLEHGHGTPQDLLRAQQCYQDALDAGFEPVAEALERVTNLIG